MTLPGIAPTYVLLCPFISATSVIPPTLKRKYWRRRERRREEKEGREGEKEEKEKERKERKERRRGERE